MSIEQVIVLALLTEALWQTGKLVWQEGALNVNALGAMAVGLLLALMLHYTLPAPFIIPLFADLGDDAEYVSTTLSLGTVLAVVLFFFLAAFSLA